MNSKLVGLFRKQTGYRNNSATPGKYRKREVVQALRVVTGADGKQRKKLVPVLGPLILDPTCPKGQYRETKALFARLGSIAEFAAYLSRKAGLASRA